MDAYPQPRSNNQQIVAEIIAGLREYQMILVDSAGKVSSSDMALKLYHLAEEHGELEKQLRHFASSEIDLEEPLSSPFLNQIRSLGQRLRKFADFSLSHYLLCEVIQVEDRMIRRFHVLIDQVSDIKWRRRLTRQLSHLLDVRDGLSRFRDCQPKETRFSSSRPAKTAISRPN